MYVNFNKICSTYSIVDNETGSSELEFDAKPCTSPMSNYAGLAAVTTVASAACHRTHAHYPWVLSALPHRRVTRYLVALRVVHRHRAALLPLTILSCAH